MFSKKKTPAEELRETEKAVRRSQRDMEKERWHIEREEKKLEAEIKKAAKQGNKQAATILAKQLIQMRKQKTKTYQVGSQIGAIGTQAKVMNSNMKMADAIKTTTKTMTAMNKTMDPIKTAQAMREFEMQSAKMEMSQEMMDDALDDAFNDSDDEEEQDAIVNQVLDEIGIEITGKMPSANRESIGAGQTALLEERLNKLKVVSPDSV